jgi:ferredoxin
MSSRSASRPGPRWRSAITAGPDGAGGRWRCGRAGRTAPAATRGDGGNAGLPPAANLPWAYEPVWVETPECTACDECIELAPKTFRYNDARPGGRGRPAGSAYRDLVKAAEKCTAGCLHPGTPWSAAEKDAAKLMQAGGEVPVNGSSIRSPGTRFEVRGSRFEVRGSRFEVRGSRFEVRGSRIEVRGMRRLRPANVAPRTSILVPRSWPVSVTGR